MLFQGLKKLLVVLFEIEHSLDRCLEKGAALMANIQEFRAALAEANTETDRIAARMEDLLGKLNAGGMSDTDEAAALAELGTFVGRLKSVGQPLTP